MVKKLTIFSFIKFCQITFTYKYNNDKINQKDGGKMTLQELNKEQEKDHGRFFRSSLHL